MEKARFAGLNTVPSLRAHQISLEGAGTSAPVVHEGVGVTVARQAAGVYRITWGSFPGRFVGVAATLGADDPADLAGYTAVRGAYSEANRTLDIRIASAADAAADLGADEYLDLLVYFSTVNA